MYRDLSEAIAFKAADWHHRLPVAHVGWEAFLIILGALLVELGWRQLVIGAKAIVGFAGKLPNQFILANEIAKAVKDRLALVDFHPAQKMWTMSDDDIRAKKSIRRKISLRVPHYSAALSATAQTDLVYTMPRILAPHAQQAFGLQISELPFESPLRKIFQVWHKTRTKEFGHQWLRAVVAKAANMAGIRADDLT
jgi:hypothetical protein